MLIFFSYLAPLLNVVGAGSDDRVAKKCQSIASCCQVSLSENPLLNCSMLTYSSHLKTVVSLVWHLGHFIKEEYGPVRVLGGGTDDP